MSAYRLKTDGQIVPIKTSEPTLGNGMTAVISRAKVGHAGEVFTNLPDSLIEKIDAGKMDDTWEKVDLEAPAEYGDPEASSEEQAETPDYEAASQRDLMAEATRRGLDVEGTGNEGRVLKSDLVAALKADDEAN